jgi:hypothetical protein
LFRKTGPRSERVLGPFFFLTQRELFTTTVAVVTAVAGGIPSLVGVVGMFERKPDASVRMS